MRIIAGKHRGRTLKEFGGRDIRPTSDRAKEALFNILQFDIAGCSFLDLYSGTGGIGLEAISRGAEKVVFVDNSRESVKLLKENLAYLKEKADIFEGDALAYVSAQASKLNSAGNVGSASKLNSAGNVGSASKLNSAGNVGSANKLNSAGKFDFVFLDPPYATDAKDVVTAIAKNGLLKEGGRIIYEHSGASLGDIDGVLLVDSRTYGIAVFDFYVAS